jgi:hypothetical protein
VIGKPQIKQRIIHVLPAFLLLGLNLLLFGTFGIYAGNLSEFDHDYLTLLVPLAGALGVFLMMGLVAALLLPMTARRKLCSVVMALRILTWLQGSILVRDYGVFDARGLDVDPFSPWGWVDLALWVLLLGGAWRYSRVVARHAAFISFLLIGVQFAYVTAEALPVDERMRVREAPEPNIPEGILQYSVSRNVVHIVLDGFQTDIFTEIVEEGSLEDEFDGFWLFSDNMAVSQLTSFSLPAVFSGEIFDGSLSPESYYKRSMSGRNFPNILYENGYVVNLAPMMDMKGGQHTNYYTIPSLYGESVLAMARNESGRLLDYSLFRQSPHFLKGIVYNNNNWLIGGVIDHASRPSFGQKLFFRDYTQGVRATLKEPAYHFVHLLPPHPPYVTTQGGDYAGRVLPNNRTNSKSEARSVVRLLLTFLDRLRELGLYDSSLIVVHGDHGSNFPPVLDGKEIPMRLTRVPTLLAVKPPDNSGPLRVSAVQSSVADIAATVLALLGIGHDLRGESVFDLDENQSRVREFFVYAAAEGVPRVETYTVEGSVFEDDSWTTGPVRRVLEDRHVYTWGDEIRFGIEGNSGPYRGKGWSGPHRRVTWNNGDQASLRFLVEPPGQDVRLEMKFIPCIYPEKHTLQRVRVSANGTALAEWETDEKKIYLFAVVIPEEVLSTPELVLKLEFPDAVRPASIGAGGDRRKLAIALGWVRMSLAGEPGDGDR